MAQSDYDALARRDDLGGEDPLTIELIFESPQELDALRARVASALPEATFDVEPAFASSGGRYFFVDFPEIAPIGQEPGCFALARALAAATEATEGNAVLPDSLFGAEHIGAAEGLEGLFNLCSTPRDDDLPFGWHHQKIDTEGAWAHGRGSGITVAVIDTGYSDHAELRDVVGTKGEINFVEGGTDARDRFSGGVMRHPGHGTLVYSVVASRGGLTSDGGTTGPGAVTGTAPAAKIMPIRAIKSVIDATQRRIPDAIEHAANEGADVIAMALGGPVRVGSTEAALQTAVDAGCVIVCAAGNCWPNVVFPAAYAPLGLCTAIAALQPDKKPWKKSGRGSQVTFSAYGEQVWGAAKNRASDPINGIRASQGTTLATSMTAGVAALWVARHGGRAALLAKAQSLGTTVQAMWMSCATRGMQKPAEWGSDIDKLGAGILNAKVALEAPLPTGTEAAPAPSAGSVPTLDILQAHLADTNEAALDELDTDIAPFAQELLWMSYRQGARARAMASVETEMILPGDMPSAELSESLQNRPGLRQALGL